MSAWLAPLAGALVAAFWLAVAARIVARRRSAPPLPAGLPSIPSTTILLPVRDEEANLPDCARTLLAQAGAPALRIVDDGSTDGTPRQVAALAAASGRVTARLARPLAAGWTGKINALATAFADLDSEWVLLTDADTRHAPDLLARAHAAIAEHRLDALSLAGTEEARGLGENLLTPAVFALLDLELGDWAPYARGDGAPPLANGQYFLLRAAALRSVGGFAAIVGQPLDDVALARALDQAGHRVGFRRAGTALRVRMYRGLAATVRGWRRNLALILGQRRARIAGIGLLALATVALPGLTLLSPASAWPLALAWTGGAAASAWTRRSSGNHPLWGLLFPLDLLALSALLLVAARDRRRGRLAGWRGRPLASFDEP